MIYGTLLEVSTIWKNNGLHTQWAPLATGRRVFAKQTKGAALIQVPGGSLQSDTKQVVVQSLRAAIELRARNQDPTELDAFVKSAVPVLDNARSPGGVILARQLPPLLSYESDPEGDYWQYTILYELNRGR